MEVQIKFKVKAGKVGNSVKITLPTEIKEYMEIKDGDTVILYEEAGRIILEKEKPKALTS
jgi:AbrB family looped-hinge helix DNA binding protein